jgi:hypothetical protein
MLGNVLKTQLRIFTMKKSVLTIALATAAISLAFSGSPNAGPGLDGKPDVAVTIGDTVTTSILINTTPTGATTPTFAPKVDWPHQGIKLQGIKLQGVSMNGWHLQDLRLKGDVLPGTSMQATKLQGMELQSVKVEGGQLVGVTRVAAE